MRRFWVATAAVAACALTAVAGCSSSPPPPASPLSRPAALTCAGARDCASPGTVRWSVPLPGSAQFDIETGTAVLNLPAATAAGTSYGDIPSGYLASVAAAAGLLAFQRGRAAVEAVDPVTGKRRWATRLPLPSGFSPAGSPPGGALDISLVIANGLIIAYDQADYLWWLLNAATGSVSPPRRLAAYSQPGSGPTGSQASLDVLPVTSRSVVLVNYTSVQDIDPVTGSVRWQVPVRPSTGDTVISHVLYLDNDPYNYNFDTRPNGPVNGAPTAIQRVDLTAGRSLPELPLAAGLHGQGGKVTQYTEDPGALFVTAGNVLARLDPATGRAIWARALPATTVGPAQAGPGGATPSADFLVAPPPSSAIGPPPSPGTGGAIWRVMVISLATGQVTSVALGRSFRYGAAGIDTFNGGDGANWNLYGSVMLAAGTTAARPAGTGGYSFTRLEGVNPQTGRVAWRGPWGGDLYVLGETVTGPPVIIMESCAPSGLAPDKSAIHGDEAFCTSERLYAVNA